MTGLELAAAGLAGAAVLVAAARPVRTGRRSVAGRQVAPGCGRCCRHAPGEHAEGPGLGCRAHECLCLSTPALAVAR